MSHFYIIYYFKREIVLQYTRTKIRELYKSFHVFKTDYIKNYEILGCTVEKCLLIIIPIDQNRISVTHWKHLRNVGFSIWDILDKFIIWWSDQDNPTGTHITRILCCSLTRLDKSVILGSRQLRDLLIVVDIYILWFASVVEHWKVLPPMGTEFEVKK